MTQATEIQQDYWTEFLKYVGENSQRLEPKSPSNESWTEFLIGIPNVHITAAMDTRTSSQLIQVQLVLERESGNRFFQLLSAERLQIEQEIGQGLIWNEIPKTKKTISIIWYSTNPSKREQWTEQHSWLLAYCERFYRVFRPRLLNILQE